MSEKYPTMYKRARNESHYTQEQAAEKLFVSVKTVKAWEQGQRPPEPQLVAKMVQLYQTPWLAWEYALRTMEPLGILPDGISLDGIERQRFSSSSMRFINEAVDMLDDYRDLMRIAEDDVIDQTERPRYNEICAGILRLIVKGALMLCAQAIDETKKERPEAGTSKRSGSANFSASDCKNIISHRQRIARASFAGEGGASL